MKKERDKKKAFKDAFKNPANIYYTPEDMRFGSIPFSSLAKEVLILIPISIHIPPVKIEELDLPPHVRFAFQQIKNLEAVNHKSENELRIEFLTLIVEGHLFIDWLGRMFSPDTEEAKAAIRRLYGKETD